MGQSHCGAVKPPKPAALSRRGLLQRGLWLGLALGVVGCLAPTLPLPPPDKPDIEGPDPRGYVTLSGYVPRRAMASALNTETGEIAGQVTGEDGYYRFQLQAQIGDELLFWYDRETERSPSVRVTVREP